MLAHADQKPDDRLATAPFSLNFEIQVNYEDGKTFKLRLSQNIFDILLLNLEDEACTDSSRTPMYAIPQEVLSILSSGSGNIVQDMKLKVSMIFEKVQKHISTL